MIIKYFSAASAVTSEPVDGAVALLRPQIKESTHFHLLPKEWEVNIECILFIENYTIS